MAAPGWAVLETEGVLARWGEWGGRPPFRVAGFDLNDTLVASRLGRPGYRLTSADWRFLTPQVPRRLRELHAEGWLLAIFSNQGNIRRAYGGRRAAAVREYVDAALQEIGVPLHVFLATTPGPCRKPSAGMWGLLAEAAAPLGGLAAGGFYVGDALGGPAAGGRAEDLGFARAAGLRVFHPRAFFAEGPPPALEGGAKSPHPDAVVLVLVGLPGSGKTSFAQALAEPGGAREWARISQDLLGSRQKCLRALRAALGQGFSAVVDRTNLDPEQRAIWREAAAAAGASCHCLVFDHVSVETCEARVAARRGHEGGVEGEEGRAICRFAARRRRGAPALEGFVRLRALRGADELAAELEHYRRPPAS